MLGMYKILFKCYLFNINVHKLGYTSIQFIFNILTKIFRPCLNWMKFNKKILLHWPYNCRINSQSHKSGCINAVNADHRNDKPRFIFLHVPNINRFCLSRLRSCSNRRIFNYQIGQRTLRSRSIPIVRPFPFVKTVQNQGIAWKKAHGTSDKKFFPLAVR